MVVATLSLVGLFVALYLSLWSYGFMGELVCTVGGCETVQTSKYAKLFGVPVAVFGVGGYLALLGVSLLGLQPAWAARREPTIWLALLSGAGVAYSAYLTYLEAFVIHAWCQWCVVSAILMLLIFAAALAGLRRPRSA